MRIVGDSCVMVFGCIWAILSSLEDSKTFGVVGIALSRIVTPSFILKVSVFGCSLYCVFGLIRFVVFTSRGGISVVCQSSIVGIIFGG